MASTLNSVSDCCDECVCNVVSVTLPCTGGDGSFLTVLNTSALRLVLANRRSNYMTVRVLTDIGVPLDGTGYDAVWDPTSLAPDGPIAVCRPADVIDDSLPGRYLQYL